MKNFRTRGGQCQITDEAIRIEDSYVGRIKRHYDENRGLFLLWLIMVSLWLLYSFVTLHWRLFALGVGFGLAVGGVYLAFGYAYNYIRDFTYDDQIRRGAIETVKPVSGTKWISRPRFIVKYRRDGERKNRYIQMPSKFGYGDEEFERAKEIFRSENVPLEEG